MTNKKATNRPDSKEPKKTDGRNQDDVWFLFSFVFLGIIFFAYLVMNLSLGS